MVSTTAQGALLVEKTAALLRASGLTVEREQLIGHKKPDLLVTERRYGTTIRTAVECKFRKRNLNKDELVKIWADYQPLVDRNLVDELLVVTSKGHSPAAVTYANEHRYLHLRDVDTLTNDALGIAPYLNALLSGYQRSTDGLPHYYVPPTVVRDGEAQNLEEMVRAWINDEPTSVLSLDRPLAILGAYGLGKSSFACHLAARLAAEAEADSARRIPVLISLSEIGGNQLLSGLLGRHFTDLNSVKGYNYELFRQLNESGRFVILLDGFDEMKQMLTWNEFKFNMGELNKLHSSRGKLIILGRPTAFMNDREHDRVLHGVRDGVIAVRDPDWPDYQEIALEPLGRTQISEFLQKYLSWRMQLDPVGIHKVQAMATSREMIDLARRPVQLRMLAEVLPRFHGELQTLGLGKLYALFIDDMIEGVIERETKKSARLHFDSTQRRDFLSELAFWAWTNSKGNFLTIDQIPDEIVSPYVRDGDKIEAVRRDLFVAAPLEKRAGERARFAHKSFQEFLVAEAIWDRLDDRRISLEEADQLLTGEVAEFLKEIMHPSNWPRRYALLRDSKEPMSARLVNTMFMEYDATRDLVPPAVPTPWELIILTVQSSLRRKGDQRTSAKVLPRILDLHVGEPLLRIFCSLFAWEELRHPSEQLSKVLLDIGTGHDFESVTAQSISQRQRLWPLSQGFVLDVRAADLRLGQIRRGGAIRLDRRRGLPYLEAGTDVSISWVPQPFVSLAGRTRFAQGGRADISGWRSVLGRGLRAGPHITDWLDGDSLRGSVRLPAVIELREQALELVRQVGAAQDEAREVQSLVERVRSRRQRPKEYYR